MQTGLKVRAEGGPVPNSDVVRREPFVRDHLIRPDRMHQRPELSIVADRDRQRSLHGLEKLVGCDRRIVRFPAA